jgi:hypothetical protein
VRLRTSQTPNPTSDVVTRVDFVALYERCVASGLKARVFIRYAARKHEVSITCSLSPPTAVDVILLPDAVVVAAATGTTPQPSMTLRHLRPLPTPIAIPFQRIWRHRLR